MAHKTLELTWQPMGNMHPSGIAAGRYVEYHRACKIMLDVYTESIEQIFRWLFQGELNNFLGSAVCFDLITTAITGACNNRPYAGSCL